MAKRLENLSAQEALAKLQEGLVRLIDENPYFWDSLPEKLNLSTRATNVLNRAKVRTFEQLCEWSADRLLKQRNCGLKTVAEIRKALKGKGLALKGES